MVSLRARLLEPLLEAVIPRDCAGCRVPGTSLCRACERDLRLLEPELQALGAWAASDTLGLGRSVVRALKEQQDRSLAPVLGYLLAAAVECALPCGSNAAVLLVPVPPRKVALRERGIDCTALVAAAAARELNRRGEGSAAMWAAARWRRQPHDQRRLPSQERAVNVAGGMTASLNWSLGRPLGRSFAWSRGRYPPALVVAVDDVVTTGSSLRELIRALTAAGLDPVGAAAAVATPAPWLRRS